MGYFFHDTGEPYRVGRLYVRKTKSNVFFVFTDLNNKPVRVASAGMAISQSRITVRGKLLPKTIGVLTKAFAKLILLRKILVLDVIFENSSRRYTEVILENLEDVGIKVRSLLWKQGFSFNGCKKRKKKRK